MQTNFFFCVGHRIDNILGGGHSMGGKGSRAGDEWSKLVSAANALHKNTHCLHYIARYSLLDHNAFVPIGENIFASVKNLC